MLGFRQELNAAFAADVRARVTGRPAAVLVSTSSGALMTLAALRAALGPDLRRDPVRRAALPAELDVPELDGVPEALSLPTEADLDRAAALLATAERPLVVAGGGAVRSGATVELAERLGAPVATTFTGKGAIPERHRLAAGNAWDEPARGEFVAESDLVLVLVVGSWIGYELTDAFLGLQGSVVQVDAAPKRIGINVPAIGLRGDAKPVLRALLDRLQAERRHDGEARAARV